MKLVNLFALLCGCLCASAQVKNLSISVALNQLVIADATRELPLNPIPIPTIGYYSSTTSAKLSDAYNEKPGFKMAASFQAFGFKNVFIETGIAFQYNRYKRSTFVESAVPTPKPDFTRVSGTIRNGANENLTLDPFPDFIFPERGRNVGETTTFYVRVPIMLGTSALKDRLLLKAGLVTDFLAWATEYKERYSYSSGINEYKDRSTDGFSNMLAGGVIKSTYLITNRVGVDLSYHRSFTRIYNSDEVGKSYYNTFSIGGSYYFYNVRDN